MRHVMLAALCALLGLSACTVGGQRSVSAENDRLRRQIIDLEAQAAAFKGERDELAIKLRESLRAGSLPAADAIQALPVTTHIEIDTMSGFDPADSTKPATHVVFAVRPLDGRGRFVQVAGLMTVEALSLPASISPDATGEPTRLVVATIAAADLREAYREGFGGARYEVMVPLPAPLLRGQGQTPTLVLRVELTDALTRTMHHAERTVRPRQ